jgi:peptide-methionine (S)-S-oxide reductase
MRTVSVQKIGFGGGCHWCTEGVFQALSGVCQVNQGWISHDGLDTSLSEGVIVEYNPKAISLEVLIDIHLITHSSSSEHKMRGKYRSAIYAFDDQQQRLVSQILEKHNKKKDRKVITQVLPMSSFKWNDEAFLNYYQKRPNAPFCTKYIKPKIEALVLSHNKYVKPSALS